MLFREYQHCLPPGKKDARAGSVETRVSQRGRKPALNQADILDIDQLIQAQPDITIHEIRDRLKLPISDETVRKAVLKLGYVYKKKSLHVSEQGRPRCQGQEGGMEKAYAGERHK